MVTSSVVGVPVALPEAVTSTSSKSQRVSESPAVQSKSTVVAVSPEAAKADGTGQVANVVKDTGPTQSLVSPAPQSALK